MTIWESKKSENSRNHPRPKTMFHVFINFFNFHPWTKILTLTQHLTRSWFILVNINSSHFFFSISKSLFYFSNFKDDYLELCFTLSMHSARGVLSACYRYRRMRTLWRHRLAMYSWAKDEMVIVTSRNL